MLSAALLFFAPSAAALDPHRTLTQYSRNLWTQQHGLPQDSIRAIAQTADGYLWLGTDEGLARFDGYEFALFNKANSELPANAISALETVPDGSLWIGTSNGLVHYKNNQFRTYTVEQGLPDNAITSLHSDHTGVLWIVAGVYLSRYQDGRFTSSAPGRDLPVASMRLVREGARHEFLVAGFRGVGRLSDGKYIPLVDAVTLGADIVTDMIVDRRDHLWIAGSLGMIERLPGGQIRRYTERDGLPDIFARAVLEDRDGNLWVGTNSGLARLEGTRFVSAPGSDSEDDLVSCITEDREGDLWIGTNHGLVRLRDDIFRVYGRPEGLPSDEPNTVFQDRTGRIWVGFHADGLMLLSPGRPRTFTPRDGMPNTEVFTIREDSQGGLIMATRAGFVRMRDSRFESGAPPDSIGRRVVFDALEDSAGRLWLAAPDGLTEMRGGVYRKVVGGSPLLIAAVVTLAAGQDGTLWAGTYGKGLWRIRDGVPPRLYTVADGLSSDRIRTLREDPGGTLWIGTFGGGLNAFRDGKFRAFTQKHGLLSNNVAGITDDGESLWLSTTRGICRVPKRQLAEMAAGARRMLEPIDYGVGDGLRSAQCAPSYPVGGGGSRTSDGRLWFTTSRGLAVYDPRVRRHESRAPLVHVVEMSVDGRRVDLAGAARLAPGDGRIQIRYTGIYLGAPERVQYSYRLQGLDSEWVRAGTRRVINYNSLRRGKYRFTVRAEVPGGLAGEQSYDFELLPHYYETAWFRGLCVALVLAAAWGVYQWRLRQIRSRFSLVLEERARLAREIHDTLAQGFVGISSQLDAVAMSMPENATPARSYLEIARRMARHSLTEARRSVMDLRASVLQGQDLASALRSGARMWTIGSRVEVELAVDGAGRELPQDVEQHLLRIAQEAVANVLKHAGATKIRIELHENEKNLCLRIVDNGRGFEQKDAFFLLGGHFGLIGMRERAERVGGELRLESRPGQGTEVEVRVPLQ